MRNYKHFKIKISLLKDKTRFSRPLSNANSLHSRPSFNNLVKIQILLYDAKISYRKISWSQEPRYKTWMN